MTPLILRFTSLRPWEYDDLTANEWHDLLDAVNVWSGHGTS